jgi:hypothetical protein
MHPVPRVSIVVDQPNRQRKEHFTVTLEAHRLASKVSEVIKLLRVIVRQIVLDANP